MHIALINYGYLNRNNNIKNSLTTNTGLEYDKRIQLGLLTKFLKV